MFKIQLIISKVDKPQPNRNVNFAAAKIIQIETNKDRYKDKISGALTCSDRVVISGILTLFSNKHSMTSYLYSEHIRIFDYAKFAGPFRNQIRENAENLYIMALLPLKFVTNYWNKL
jgi:hypothetical protein